MSEDIHFQQLGFDQLTSKQEYGCLITNPPYGLRLSDRDEVDQLYHSFPLVLRHLPSWSYFILTSHSNFEKVVGREADRRRKLYNGRIQCTLFQFHGPKRGTKRGHTPEELPNESATPLPTETKDETTVQTDRQRKLPTAVFGGLLAKDHEQAELFRSRLTKRARHFRRWPTRQGITCFRLYERDIPELPLVVDRYEDHLHITEYERPHERDPARHADWLDLMVRTAAETLDVDQRKVFFKRRDPTSKKRQHDRVAEDHYEIEVQEGGSKFIVNLSDYVDTGLFLDHRITRSMVRDQSVGKRFLNLFAYTGAFSVYAATGGAAETTTVDWSPTYLDWAKRNMSVNGFTSVEHRFVRSDAREFLAAGVDRESYDLAVLDPPTFSNSKRSQSDWIIQEHYAELLNATLRIMNPAGIIFFSTNFRRFKMDESTVDSNEIHEISRQTVPLDFRNRRIHRCWRIMKTLS